MSSQPLLTDFERQLRKLRTSFLSPKWIHKLTLQQISAIIGLTGLLVGSIALGYLINTPQDIRQQAAEASTVCNDLSVSSCIGVQVGYVGGCNQVDGIEYRCKSPAEDIDPNRCHCLPVGPVCNSSEITAPACRRQLVDGSCAGFDGTCRVTTKTDDGSNNCACVANSTGGDDGDEPVANDGVCQTGETCNSSDCQGTPQCNVSGPTPAPNTPSCNIWPKLRVDGVGLTIEEPLRVHLGDEFTIRAKIDSVVNGTVEEVRFRAQAKDATSPITITPAERFIDGEAPFEATFTATALGKSYIIMNARFPNITGAICKYDLAVKVFAPPATSTPLPTATSTPTPTPAIAATATPRATATPTANPTTTPTLIPTATPNPTATPTSFPTPTPRPTFTASPTPTPSPSSTTIANATFTPTPQATATPTPTATSIANATNTPTPSGTAIPGASPTSTPVATATYTSTPSSTQTPALPAAGGESSTTTAIIVTSILVLFVGAIGLLLLI